jgi:hypothetical protein
MSYSIFLSNVNYFYKQTDGEYRFPNSAEGDLIKQAKKEIQELMNVDAPDTTETIETAAVIDKKGLIYTMPRPARHHNIIILLPLDAYSGSEQGFITSKGRFVGRKEAFDIAKSNMQPWVNPPFGNSGDLFSENLW